jgi:hypothetical protein
MLYLPVVIAGIFGKRKFVLNTSSTVLENLKKSE